MPALAHLGLGFAVKRFVPEIPLWILLISSMFLDLMSFVILFTLWPTHSLIMSIVWSISLMVIAQFTIMLLKSRKDKSKSKLDILKSIDTFKISLIFGLLVFSHWVLDLIGWPMTVINPTLTGTPIFFDDTITIGLGVYSSWFGALTMDIGLFVIGLAIYIHYMLKLKQK